MTTPDPIPRPRPLAGLVSRLVGKARTWAGEKGSARRVIARNSAWEMSSWALYAVVMFFLSPFIQSRLGNSLYGVWEMVISLTGYLSFAEFGVRPAAVHFIARYEAQKDYASLNGFVNTSFLTFSAAGLLMLVVAVPMAALLPRLWHVAPGFETEASIALLVVAGEMALSLPLNAFSAVIVGKQRYDRLGQIRLVVNIVYTGLIVLVLSQGLGLVALALVVAVTKIGQMIVFTIAAFRLEPNLRFAPRLATLESARRLLGFGGWAVVVILAQNVIWATDSLVVGGAISAAAVAFFAIGFKLPYQARDLLRVATRVVEPAFGALHGLGDRDGIRALLTKGVQVVLHLAAPIAAYLFVVGEPFLRTWFTPEHAAGSSDVLQIITIAVVPAIASGPIASAYYGTNRVRPLALLFLLEAALNLGLSIALVGPYGIEGVALGTALPAVLIHAFLLPWLLCRHYRISLPSFLARAWIGPLLAGGVTYAALRAIVEPTDTLGWVPLIALTGLSVAVYGAAALVIRRVFPALIGAGPLLKVEPPTESGS